jgi:hypothetical protein
MIIISFKTVQYIKKTIDLIESFFFHMDKQHFYIIITKLSK